MKEDNLIVTFEQKFSVERDELLAELVAIETEYYLEENLSRTRVTVNPELVAQAIEKHTPKKVYDRRHFHPLSNLYFGNCPVCNELQTTTCNYCFKCGQKLDWEVE